MKTVEADIIHCACAVADLTVTAGQPWVQDQETSFMYMPAGRHTIIAGFRGKAIELTVEIVPEDAAKVLSASMEQLQASQPKQRLFGCIEHAEKDASVWAKKFEARPDGVYLCAEPSGLGARHVNEKIHRSWSPSFLTDADYAKARLVSDIYQFPEGVKGSRTNPAKITGCAFCLGTLTNKPAFREMSPVMAREAVDAVVMATGTSGPTPFNPQPFLDFLSQLRLAHWAADTSTEEHETLGELYEQLESLVDEFVEQSLGAEGTTVVTSAPSLPELLESGCALVQAELDRAPSEGVKNTLAEMCGALDKARYLLKAKDQDMKTDTVTAGGTSAGAKKGWESRDRHEKLVTHHLKSFDEAYAAKDKDEDEINRHILSAKAHHYSTLASDGESHRQAGLAHEEAAKAYPKTDSRGEHHRAWAAEHFRENYNPATASVPTTATDILRATWSPQAREAAAVARRFGAQATLGGLRKFAHEHRGGDMKFRPLTPDEHRDFDVEAPNAHTKAHIGEGENFTVVLHKHGASAFDNSGGKTRFEHTGGFNKAQSALEGLPHYATEQHLKQAGFVAASSPTPTATDILRATWSPQAREAAAEARRARAMGEAALQHTSSKMDFDAGPEHHALGEKLHTRAAEAFKKLGDKEKQAYHEEMASFHRESLPVKSSSPSPTPTAADVLRASNPISSHAGANGQPAV